MLYKCTLSPRASIMELRKNGCNRHRFFTLVLRPDFNCLDPSSRAVLNHNRILSQTISTAMLTLVEMAETLETVSAAAPVAAEGPALFQLYLASSTQTQTAACCLLQV